MALFFSQRNKPRKFEYIPRYYDPEDEARQKRSRQLRAEAGKPDNEEYTPGSIIRKQGFQSRTNRKRRVSSGRPLRLILIILLLLAGAYFLMKWQFNFKLF